MEVTSDAMLLRIFVSSTDKFKHSPIYEVVVYASTGEREAYELRDGENWN